LFQVRLTVLIPTLAGIALALTPFLWCRLRGETPESYGLSWKFSRKGFIECAVVTAVALAALTVISMNWPGEDLPRRVSFSHAASWAVNGVSAAVIEEVFFRGWVQPMFRKRFGAITSITITSVIFACAHVFVARAFFIFAVFFPGFIMGALRERHGNISTPTLFHAVANLWAIWFIPMFFPAFGDLLYIIGL